MELENGEYRKKIVLRDERIKQLENSGRGLVSTMRQQAERHVSELSYLREQVQVRVDVDLYVCTYVFIRVLTAIVCPYVCMSIGMSVRVSPCFVSLTHCTLTHCTLTHSLTDSLCSWLVRSPICMQQAERVALRAAAEAQQQAHRVDSSLLAARYALSAAGTHTHPSVVRAAAVQ